MVRPVRSDLISRAQAGDGDAFRELTEPHRRELQVHCYRMLGSVQDAEDALQDTLLAAWQSIGGFSEERASLRTWLYRVATNRCLNMRRSASRRPTKEWDVPKVEPPEPTRLGEVVWLEPYPDALLEGALGGPPGEEYRFNLLARGRQNIAVDLKNKDGVTAVLRLIDRADALIEHHDARAREVLEAGSAGNSRSQRALYLLSEAQRRTRDFAAAEVTARRLMSLDTRGLLGPRQLALIFQDQNDHQKTVALLEPIVSARMRKSMRRTSGCSQIGTGSRLRWPCFRWIA